MDVNRRSTMGSQAVPSQSSDLLPSRKRKLSLPTAPESPQSKISKSSKLSGAKDKKRLVEEIVAFLEAFKYSALTKDKLMKPTAKDFQSLATFLLNKSDARYKEVRKLDDEYLGFLKKVRYPVQLSRASLYALGASKYVEVL